LAKRAIELLGHVDILVNNAALKTRSNLESTDAAVFDQVIAVNLRAPLLLARSFLPHFTACGGAAILNIGSINAYCGERDLLAYSISKGGLMTLTRNLADAYAAEGIRVNQLNLGWVLTQSEDELKRAEGFPPGWAEKLPTEVAPTGRLLDPDEVAHFALAFVEPSAHPVSGAIVDIEQYPLIGRNPPKTITKRQRGAGGQRAAPAPTPGLSSKPVARIGPNATLMARRVSRT
jgi:NAD(P)-dependent dehydrogenase (short-subunit alcohol dehydrogenase family)